MSIGSLVWKNLYFKLTTQYICMYRLHTVHVLYMACTAIGLGKVKPSPIENGKVSFTVTNEQHQSEYQAVFSLSHEKIILCICSTKLATFISLSKCHWHTTSYAKEQYLLSQWNKVLEWIIYPLCQNYLEPNNMSKREWSEESVWEIQRDIGMQAFVHGRAKIGESIGWWKADRMTAPCRSLKDTSEERESWKTGGGKETEC